MWTAAGQREEEVVWVKAAVVWICVYLGKPAVATLPACYFKYLTQPPIDCDNCCFKASGDLGEQDLSVWGDQWDS